MPIRNYISGPGLLIIWLWLGLPSHAQQNTADNATPFDLAFERLELPGEANGNSVQAIIQDQLGFLWFGSQSGLHRYDGKNFITYNSDPINQNTLNSDYIENIYIDPEGVLWLTHWGGGGLTAYDPQKEQFTRYSNDPDNPESILPAETGAIVGDTAGNIWVGGRQGLSRLDPATGKFKRYSHDPDDPSSLSDNEIGMLYVDTGGTLWVATGMPWNPDGRGGLNRYDPETDSFIRYLHDPDDSTTLSNNKVRTLYEDSRGNFWVGTAGDGLHRFDKDNETFTHYPFDPGGSDRPSMPFLKGTDLETANPWSHITSIFEDQDGRLWIAAVYSGLNVYDPELGFTKHYEAQEEAGEDELESNFVWKVYQSDDGTLWVSTGGEGRAVYKVKENRFRFPFFLYGELQDPQSVFRGIIKDSNGNIWMGMSPPNPNSSTLRSKLWEIREGSTRPEMVRLRPESSSPELNSFMGSISLDASGNIWAGTFEGYYVADPREKNFKIFVPDVGAADEDVWVAPVLHTRSGVVWIPYWGHGVIRYDPENENYEIFEHNPNDPTSISGATVWGMYEDSSGHIWVGGGSFTPSSDTPLFLDRYDPQTKTFDSYITTVLPYGITSHITEDVNGNLWFGDWNFGLYKLNPATREVKKFTSSNSLLPGTRISSIIQHPDGKIWIATDYELIELDPVQETFSIYGEPHGIVPALGSSTTGYLSKDGQLLFARWEGFHAFKPDELLGEIKSNLPDLRITGFKLLDDRMYSGQSDPVLQEPIWKTERIELDNTQNTFSFSVACFDFYEPEANTIQFMLEGYDRGWRGDIRNGETPYYVNIAPGEYTFRMRGANGLGVWNTEGISMEIIVNPPWWKTWWAYSSYGVMFIGMVLGTHKIQRRRVLVEERKRAQRKELEHAREIEKAYQQLQATQTQLIHSEKMASLGELTAGIAHEIQNPLNFVNNFAEVNQELIEELKEESAKKSKERNAQLERELLSDIDQNLKKISHHGKRAESIVKGMLQHSRNADGKKEATDLNKLADEYLRLAYHGLRAKDKSFNASMETDFDQSVGEVNMVPQDIGRVLLNLLTNAFHAVSEKKKEAPEGYDPTVTVHTRKTPEGVEISVADNGNGIPDEIRDKIFQPFFTTKPTGEGTGLGLSMSYDIVTKGHGGELTVTSEEGKSTTFTMVLPVK